MRIEGAINYQYQRGVPVPGGVEDVVAATRELYPQGQQIQDDVFSSDLGSEGYFQGTYPGLDATLRLYGYPNPEKAHLMTLQGISEQSYQVENAAATRLGVDRGLGSHEVEVSIRPNGGEIRVDFDEVAGRLMDVIGSLKKPCTRYCNSLVTCFPLFCAIKHFKAI